MEKIDLASFGPNFAPSGAIPEGWVEENPHGKWR